MLESLDNKRLIFVTGKGGVGKSACTAGLAMALSRRGRRVLVVETDAYSAMTVILGAGQSEHTIVHVIDGLYAINLRSKQCLVETLTRYLPSERVVRAITQNRVTESFFTSAPSVNEFVLLDKILALLETEDRAWDHIVVDLPASGHALTFLGVPRTLNAMMRNVGPIAKRASEVDSIITNASKSAVVAICLPEEMPVNETIELAANLKTTLGRSLDLTLVNMVHDRPISEDHEDDFERASMRLKVRSNPTGILSDTQSTPVQRILAGNQLALRWYKRDHTYLQILHEQLQCEIVELPMVYEVDETKIVDILADHMNSKPRPAHLAS
jgi:anion-transporting  ArsA/GET3 family ATPase